MKNTITLVVCLLSVVLSLMNEAQAQTSANGPYYAWPAWDQKLQCDTLATCPRFIVLSNWNNEAVLDRETGLVWERSPSTTHQDWRNAQISCNRKVVGNRKGWRLPTIQELASLVEPTVPPPGPTLPAGHPFNNLSSEYWSATTLVQFTDSAWFVSLNNGDVNVLGKIGSIPVWCVRGGQGVDPQ
jgi:uncharacterized protein DUF1566